MIKGDAAQNLAIPITETRERLNAAHAPLPWLVAEGVEPDSIVIISEHIDDAIVALIGQAMPNAEANAEFIRRAANEHDALLSIAECARDFIWEPENWEAYMESKESNSVAWPPEFLLMARAVEKHYGAMPVTEEK